MKLYDKQWVSELARRAATDEVFQRKARGFDAIYQYGVKPPKESAGDKPFVWWIKFPEATVHRLGLHEKHSLTMTTSYEIFHDVLAGTTTTIHPFTPPPILL